VATGTSMDPDFRPDMVAMIAVSAAFIRRARRSSMEPITGLHRRMKKLSSNFLSLEQLERVALDLVVAGTKDGIMMVGLVGELAGRKVVRPSTLLKLIRPWYPQERAGQRAPVSQSTSLNSINPIKPFQKKKSIPMGARQSSANHPVPRACIIIQNFRDEMHRNAKSRHGEGSVRTTVAGTTTPSPWRFTGRPTGASWNVVRPDGQPEFTDVSSAGQ